MPKTSSLPPDALDAAKGTAGAALPASFELAMEELEGLIARLESGQVPLDELLSGHQRAQSLMGYCRDKLQSVESVLLVESVADDGRAVTRPLEEGVLRRNSGGVA